MIRLYNYLTNSQKRKLRNRSKLRQNNNCLRISIFKSNRHFYAQLIDDLKGVTLISASTLDPEIREICEGRTNAKSVEKVSSLMAKRLSKLQIDRQLVFDRGPYKYTGIVAQFADALRSFGYKY
ncbi:MAG: 50S ribosomal protein L18 [Wolbachia endosymbiont of Fragariocoptes setiger]|nr:50S ribosomal protein L18 [Wolbachia endosymbiont of Fragariocoptes setiger]